MCSPDTAVSPTITDFTVKLEKVTSVVSKQYNAKQKSWQQAVGIRLVRQVIYGNVHLGHL